MPSQIFSETAHVMRDELAHFHRALRRQGDSAALAAAIERLQTAVNRAQMLLGDAPDSPAIPLEQPGGYQLLASYVELAQQWLRSPLLRYLWASGRYGLDYAERHAEWTQ